MFHMIAIITFLAAGNPQSQNGPMLRAPDEFATEEACMNFFDTDAGQRSKAVLEAMLSRAGKDEGVVYSYTTRCVADNEPKKDDGSI